MNFIMKNLCRILKVLEVLLFYFKHSDHNVVTAALEAFHQLLKYTPQSLRNALVRRDVLAAVIKQQSPGNFNF
jgi:hypothetical protein